MNYWPKHIGPWLKATVTLGLAEEGAYGRLVDWCYAQERPLPLDMDEVHRIARATTKADRDTTDAMVARFFVQTDSGWRHTRIERELANAVRRSTFGSDLRTGHADRQKRYRDKRRELFAQVNELALVLPDGFKTTNDQLIELIAKAGAHPRTNVAVTRDVTRDASLEAVTETAVVETTNSLSQVFEEQRDGLSVTRHGDVTRDATRDVTQAGAACLAMKRAGVPRVNPGDARLALALSAGVTVEALALAAAEAAARHVGGSGAFAWAIARAVGQMEQQQRERASLLKWAPGLAKGA